MYALEPDPEALREVLKSNPGEDLVLSYSADLYLVRPEPTEDNDDQENTAEEEGSSSQFWTPFPSTQGLEASSVLA